ncbi:hypothetical protein ACHAXS_009763 [Conticribra weissflogii]
MPTTTSSSTDNRHHRRQNNEQGSSQRRRSDQRRRRGVSSNNNRQTRRSRSYRIGGRSNYDGEAEHRGTIGETGHISVPRNRSPYTRPQNGTASTGSFVDGIAGIRIRVDGTNIEQTPSHQLNRLNGIDAAGRAVLPNFGRIINEDENLRGTIRDDDERISSVDRMVASALSRARLAAVLQDLEDDLLAFDPGTLVGFSSNDVRKPNRLTCPTCMKVHLPVKGSRKVQLSEIERRRLLGQSEEEKLDDETVNMHSNSPAEYSSTAGSGTQNNDENDGAPSNSQNPTVADFVYEADVFTTVQEGISRFNIRRDTFTSFFSEDSHEDLTSMPSLESNSDEEVNSIQNNILYAEGRNSSFDAFPDSEHLESNRIGNIIGSREGRGESFRSREEIFSLYQRHEPVGVQSLSSQSSNSIDGDLEFNDDDEEELNSFYSRYNESLSRMSSLPALESDEENSHASEESGDDVIILPMNQMSTHEYQHQPIEAEDFVGDSNAIVRSEDAMATEVVDDTTMSEAINQVLESSLAEGPGMDIIAVERQNNFVLTDSLARNETVLFSSAQVPGHILGGNSGNNNVGVFIHAPNISGHGFTPASSPLPERVDMGNRREFVGVQSVSSRENIEENEEESSVQFGQTNSSTSILFPTVSPRGTVSNIPNVESMPSSSASSISAPPSAPGSGASPSSSSVSNFVNEFIPRGNVDTQSSTSSRSGPIEVEDVSSLSSVSSSSVAVVPDESMRREAVLPSILRNSRASETTRQSTPRSDTSNNDEVSQSRISRGLADLVQPFEGRRPNNRERESSIDVRESSSNHSPIIHYLHNYGGLRVYATATCPICLEEVSPIVALPCGHPLCIDDYKRLGGYLSSDEANAAMKDMFDRQAHEQEEPARDRTRGVASAGVQSARERIINRRNTRILNGNEGLRNNTNISRSPPQHNDAQLDEDLSQDSDVSSVSAESFTRNIRISFRRQNPDPGSSAPSPRGLFINDNHVYRARRGCAWGWQITRHCHDIDCELSGTSHRQLWAIGVEGCSPEACYPLGSRVIEDGSGGLWIHRANGQDDMWPLLHKTMDAESEKYVVHRLAAIVSDGGEGVWAMSPLERSTFYSVLIHYTGDTENFTATVPASSVIFPGCDGKIWVHVNNDFNVLSRPNMLTDGLWVINDDFTEKVAGPDPDNQILATSDGFGNIWILRPVGIEDDVSVFLTRYFLEDQNIGHEEFPFVIERGSALYGCQAPQKFFILYPSPRNDLNAMRSLIFFKYDAVESRWDRIHLGQCVLDAKIASDGNDGLWIIMEGVDGSDETSGIWRANESGMSRVFPLTVQMQSIELVGA